MPMFRTSVGLISASISKFQDLSFFDFGGCDSKHFATLCHWCFLSGTIALFCITDVPIYTPVGVRLYKDLVSKCRGCLSTGRFPPNIDSLDDAIYVIFGHTDLPQFYEWAGRAGALQFNFRSIVRASEVCTEGTLFRHQALRAARIACSRRLWHQLEGQEPTPQKRAW